MRLTDWQTTVVAEMDGAIEACKDIDSLEKVAMEVALSSQPWFRAACWKTVLRVRHEICGPVEKPPVMLVIDALNWIRGDYSMAQDVDQTVSSFMRRARELCRKTCPKWIVAAGDSNEVLIRKQRCPEYKSSRSPRPAEIEDVCQKVKVACEHMQIPFIICEGYEADDIAATLSTKGICRGAKSVLCTSDKDYCQLVCKDVVLWSKNNYTNVNAVRSHYGIEPNQMVDYLCLIGKDDVPSAFGIGPKTASAMLRKHGTFFGVYEHRHEMTEKQREIVEEFAPKYWMARDCHLLNRNLNLKFDWNTTHCLIQ